MYFILGDIPTNHQLETFTEHTTAKLMVLITVIISFTEKLTVANTNF